MRPVVENIALTGTDAEDMDKYSSVSLLSRGNRLECCCQKVNGSVSELAHFIVMQFVTSMAMSVEVSCVEMSLAVTLNSRENTTAKPNFNFRWLTAKQKHLRLIFG